MLNGTPIRVHHPLYDTALAGKGALCCTHVLVSAMEHTIYTEYTYEYLTPCMQYTYALGAIQSPIGGGSSGD